MTSTSTQLHDWPYDTRVPIMRRLDEYDPDPDHVRGAKYANLLLGTDFEKGDVVHLIYLERVDPVFFEYAEEEHGLDLETDPVYSEFKRNPDVISVADPNDLPDEFTPMEAPPGVSSQ